MICPFCLNDVKFLDPTPNDGRMDFICPGCKELIPTMYMKYYKKFAPVLLNAVGFRGHGKTVFFAALFYTLKKLPVAQCWKKFYTMALNEESLDTIFKNIDILTKGTLPDSTPKNFPRPTVIRLVDMPLKLDSTLLCYDTSGEAFKKATQLVQYASFVRYAKTTLFLLSINDLENPKIEMHELINTYIVGLTELGLTPKKQNLVIVFTKADEVSSFKDHEDPDIVEYLMHSSLEELSDLNIYFDKLIIMSKKLKNFTVEKLQAYEFLNAAENFFKTVNFCIVSSLGAKPEGSSLSVEITPRRIIDPLLWTILNAKTQRKNFLSYFWE